MIEPEKPLKKKDQIKFDEEEALRLQAEFDEEGRLAREKAQQAQEKFKKSRRKRNRPPTRAQQRSIMCTDLKNMAGWKPKDLKSKSFANIQELFDKAMKRINTFVDMDIELVEGSEVREESIIPDEEEVAIDAKPLATKPPSIIDYKIIKERKISYYQIIRADGSSKRYSAFIQMLRSFDREDLEILWKLVKAKYGSTRLEEGYERVLWGDLKTMFEHHVEDIVWRNLQGNKGKIVRIKRLLDDLRVTAAQVRVTDAKHKLVLLVILMKNILSTGYSLKDKNQAKMDKTEHGIGKSVKKSKSKTNLNPKKS
ncbi:hypothetical protein Tco_0925367 [Tanacetum coccineum]|uniref:Uncharacterized protein n=1 Tax=Tanacetum coccineum TaxID=301880 RepID=A0ABQ5D9G6_9ASTR